MIIKIYDNVKSFHQDVYTNLLTHEAQNMIMIKNTKMGYDGVDKHEWRDPANWLMATVIDGEEVLLTALMTPPFGITLYATDNQINDEVLTLLVEGLEATDWQISGVVSEKGLAERFAEIYGNAKGVSFDVSMHQRIMS